MFARLIETSPMLGQTSEAMISAEVNGNRLPPPGVLEHLVSGTNKGLLFYNDRVYPLKTVVSY